MRDSWRRALAGLVLLILLMVAVSFLSGRMKGGENAARALEKADDGGPAAQGEEAVVAEGEGDKPVSLERDPVPEEIRTSAEAEDVFRDAEDPTLEGGDVAASPDVYRETPSPDLGGGLLRVFAGLTAVVLLIMVVKRLAGRRATRRGGFAHGRLEVVGYTPLGPASGIFEVKLGNRILMIGDSEKGLTLLGEVDVESLVRAEEAELLEDEFLTMLREEMEPAARPEPPSVKRPFLEELKWKTARKRRRARR